MSDRLHALQSTLLELYRLPDADDVRAFVCDAAMARALGGQDAVDRGEALLVLEDDAGSFVGLYLDEAVVDRSCEPGRWLEDGANLASSCAVAEGVSHFVLVQYRAAQQIPVSELELELQAEVDKWALGALTGRATERMLEGFGAGLLRERSRVMRRRLFSGVQLRDEEGSERAERYQRAIRLAHHYTAKLERRLGDRDGLLSELRAFYRMVGARKLEHAMR